MNAKPSVMHKAVVSSTLAFTDKNGKFKKNAILIILFQYTHTYLRYIYSFKSNDENQLNFSYVLLQALFFRKIRSRLRVYLFLILFLRLGVVQIDEFMCGISQCSHKSEEVTQLRGAFIYHNIP